MEHEIGAIVEGTVVDVVKFGAFVKIRGGKTGLIHISQISDKFVREVSEHVSVGTNVVAKIISVDDKGRIQLSLKSITPEELERFRSETGIEPPPMRQPQRDRPPQRFERREQQHHHDDPKGPEDDSFERKLKQFLRQSEDRQVDLKRNIESKRGIKKRKR